MAPRAQVTETIEAENTFTDRLMLRPGWPAAVSISGISGDTVVLQRTFDGGTTYKDVQSYTADDEDTYVPDAPCEIRLGIKTGGYSAGTVVCLLRR